MNGNFRKPEYVKRYEYNNFDLVTPLNAIVANNARQRKDNYRFVVDNSSETYPIDWYNAYLEVDFQLVTLADSAVGIVAGQTMATKMQQPQMATLSSKKFKWSAMEHLFIPTLKQMKQQMH